MDIKNINNYFNVQANNNEKEINKPKLIEPGVKYFFNGILNECNEIAAKSVSSLSPKRIAIQGF